jgi:hypothetical protein
MLNFNDKPVLNDGSISVENIEFQLEEIFPYDTEGAMLHNDLFELALKIAERQIDSGKLDDYIAQKGTKFKFDLADEIERDFGAVIVATLIDAGVVKSDYWDIPLADIQTKEVHRLPDEYYDDVNQIADKVIRSLPQEVQENKMLCGEIKMKLIVMMGNEIGTKEQSFDTKIVPQTKELMREKTPEEMLAITTNNPEKSKQISQIVNDLINKVVDVAHPALFNMLSEEQKSAIKEEMRKEVIHNVCSEIHKSRNNLYNDIYLYRDDLKTFPMGIDFAPIYDDVCKAAEEIGKITIVEETQAEHDSQLEYFAEQGIDVKPEDECQWEEFEYILQNERNSVVNIRVAIQNSINEIINRETDRVLSATSIGDEVLNGDGCSCPSSNKNTNQIDTKEIDSNAEERD